MQMQNTKGIQESMYLRRGVKSQMLKKLKQHREMGKEIPKESGRPKKIIDTVVDNLPKETKQENKLEEMGITKVKNNKNSPGKWWG